MHHQLVTSSAPTKYAVETELVTTDTAYASLASKERTVRTNVKTQTHVSLVQQANPTGMMLVFKHQVVTDVDVSTRQFNRPQDQPQPLHHQPKHRLKMSLVTIYQENQVVLLKTPSWLVSSLLL